MKKPYTTLRVFALLLVCGTLIAGEAAGQSQRDEATRAENDAMLVEAEKARIEAEAVRVEATRAAETAREIAQKRAQAARDESARANRDTAQAARDRELIREEVTRAREELSRAHRELREASRDVARAHRELSRSAPEIEFIRDLNLGDRAVIGVVLGPQTDQGVEIIGLSPDGPAERAGLLPGDVMLSIRGEALDGERSARQNVFQVMREVEDGEELVVGVDRKGQVLEYTVTAEQREPRGWQSIIRISETGEVSEAPDAPNVIMETIEIPEIDEVALAAKFAELSKRLEASAHKFVIHHGKSEPAWEFEGFSEFGAHAMDEANIWFGLPLGHGLELASINEGLGAYFKTDRGVLVIKARDGNAYALESGDVILSIDANEVNSPSDMVRALRDVEPGSEIAIEIKRNRKDKTLNVVVPENRLGYR